MKRKFIIVLEVIDDESPNATIEEVQKAFKEFLTDCLGDLAFDVKKVDVTVE